MEHIFICYSRQDRMYADRLKTSLEQAGKEVWIDTEDLPASSIWRAEIQNAIVESIAFIYLVSVKSLASEYCRKEFEFATQLNKKIFPIILQEISEKDIPEIISARQWLSWNSKAIELPDINKLITDIEKDYEWLKFVLELGIKKSRWKQQKDISRLLRGNELRETQKKLEKSRSKDPRSVELLMDYVLASRKYERQSRLQTGLLVILGTIAIITFARLASLRGNSAASAQKTAEAESRARSTAQVLAQIAEATRQAEAANAESRRQSLIAKNLIQEAQNLIDDPENYLTVSLLATEALKRSPSLESNQLLTKNLSLMPMPVFSARFDTGIKSTTFSHDGKLIAVASTFIGDDRYTHGLIQLRDTATGNEVLEIRSAEIITPLIFSPDDKWIAGGGSGGTAYVWVTCFSFCVQSE